MSTQEATVGNPSAAHMINFFRLLSTASIFFMMYLPSVNILFMFHDVHLIDCTLGSAGIPHNEFERDDHSDGCLAHARCPLYAAHSTDS